MINEAREIIKQLNSPADVAIVGAAALLGFTLDAAINIMPIPIFSPGVCGFTSAGAALTAKKAWDAKRLAERLAADAADREGKHERLLDLAVLEAERVEKALRQNNMTKAADRLNFEVRASKITKDHSALLAALREAPETPAVG